MDWKKEVEESKQVGYPTTNLLNSMEQEIRKAADELVSNYNMENYKEEMINASMKNYEEGIIDRIITGINYKHNIRTQFVERIKCTFAAFAYKKKRLISRQK